MNADSASADPGSFQVVECPALEGTFAARLIWRRPTAPPGAVVEVSCGERRCAARVESIDAGPTNRIALDPQLCSYLSAGSLGTLAKVSQTEVPICRKIELQVPEGIAGQPTREAWLRSRLTGKPLTERLEVRLYGVLSGDAHEVPVRVLKIDPDPFAEMDASTEILFTALSKEREGHIGVRWRDVAGLDHAVGKIRELVEFPARHSELAAALGVEPPRGILLHGPPGTGKTLIARALANELDAHFFFIQGPEIVSAFCGESERNLRKVFDQAAQAAKDGRLSIILIDEVDSIAPKRDVGYSDSGPRLVATFLTLLDGLRVSKGVVVLGTTNRPNAIDPALRRPFRFDYEIYCGIPDASGREQILRIHTRGVPLTEDLSLSHWASKTHGFTGADLAKLCQEAARSTFRRSISGLADLGWRTACVNNADFEAAHAGMAPSGMREILIQVPRNISWDSLGGLKNAKRIVQENVIEPLRRPAVFQSMGVRPARGLLLHGPPGTGKTLLAKAIANECEANFISIKGPELRSKWYGESEEKVRHIFDIARRHAPCIVFLDEVDSLLPSRGRGWEPVTTDSIVNQFLAEMDGVETSDGVFVIGTTNRADLIDPALLRPGRFDYQVEVGLPDATERGQIFRIHLKTIPQAPGVDVDALVAKTEGFSGAEIAEVCRLAAVLALRETDFAASNAVAQEHLLAALEESEQRRGKDGSTRFAKRVGFITT